MSAHEGSRWILIDNKSETVDSYSCRTIPLGIKNDAYPDGNNPQSLICKGRQIAQLQKVVSAVRKFKVHLLHNTYKGLSLCTEWQSVIQALDDLEATDA